MINTSLEKIDEIRRAGFRPQVVGCFVHDKKALFVYKAEHELWQFPQGGINNQETLDSAFRREMAEELGKTFVDKAEGDISVFEKDLVEFPIKTQGTRDLQTDDGKEVFMKGKLYFFAVADAGTDDLNVDDTEFDDFRWLNYQEALNLAEGIYQRGKRRVTLKALEALHKIGKI
ncbi:MAG: NUDIX domain-containing protein [bacterium]